MPRYEAQCQLCGGDVRIDCKYEDRARQRCCCGGELEFLISTTAQTRFGFGFVPGMHNPRTGETATSGKRRPATVQRS